MPESESKSESTKPAEVKREPREPRALSAEYHKARKQLMLWAGILFIWELVGIDLEKAKETGGNAGAIITAIKSPQAVPWALLILVAYFIFKTTIEWYQCNASRRRVWAARADFGSAWIATTLAYILYAYQAISRIQFADVLQGSSRWRSVLLGFPIGLVLTLSLAMYIRGRGFTSPRMKAWLIGGILGALLLFAFAGVSGFLNWRFAGIGVVLGAALISLLKIEFSGPDSFSIESRGS